LLAFLDYGWACIIHIFNAVAIKMGNAPIPITLSFVVVYTAFCEVLPKFVTRHNSNAYTSQVLYNVTLPNLRFQIVNYYLYHTKLFAIITHGLTILVDCLLWTMYFHHLLHNNPWWSFCFIFYMCLLQALTFDDVKLKITLIVIEGAMIGGAGLLYHFYLERIYPADAVFGHVSLLLLLNAFARVISHMPEPLPIDYLGLKNKLPISGWYWQKSTLQYMLYPPRLIMSTAVGVFSELQAGLPVRLLTSALVLVLTYIGWTDAGLNMQSLRQRAENIDLIGWGADSVASELFVWEDKDFQTKFKWAAAHRYHRRIKEGNQEKLKRTWLDQKDLLKGDVLPKELRNHSKEE